jgi:hypothetical protein
MSLADNFMSAAKQILLATENIKRLDEKVHRLADDVSGIDRRLIRIETFVEIGKSVPRPPRINHLATNPPKNMSS